MTPPVFFLKLPLRKQKLTIDFLSRLDSGQLERVNLAYAVDFEMFGYSPYKTESLPSAT